MKLIAVEEHFLTRAVSEAWEKDPAADPTRDARNFPEGAALSNEDKYKFAFANWERLTNVNQVPKKNGICYRWQSHLHT